jgi:uncharacterized protein YpuA (DUF1002 family)
MIKRFLQVSLCGLTLLALNENTILAAETDEKNENGMNSFVYGDSLTDAQYTDIKSKLGVKEGAVEVELKVDELNSLLANDESYNQVYSSIFIESNDGGVNVDIVTPENITAVSEEQYTNAAITAGIKDVNIYVASPIKVDGSGALAGVYRAYQVFASPNNGDGTGSTNSDGTPIESLDENSIKVAQKELATTMAIDAENSENTDYKSTSLSEAMAQMKMKISDKQRTQKEITYDEVKQIVTDTLNETNLAGVISDNNKNSIVELMWEFANTASAQSNDTAAQLKSYSKETKAQGDAAFATIKATAVQAGQEAKTTKVGIFTTIKQWFVSFFK